MTARDSFAKFLTKNMFEKDLNNKNTDYDIYKDSSSGNILALYKDCVMQRIFEKDPLCESFVRLANDYTKINDEKSKILYSDQNQINQSNFFHKCINFSNSGIFI